MLCAILRACDSLPMWRKTALLQIVQILSISGELNTSPTTPTTPPPPTPPSPSQTPSPTLPAPRKAQQLLVQSPMFCHQQPLRCRQGKEPFLQFLCLGSYVTCASRLQISTDNKLFYYSPPARRQHQANPHSAVDSLTKEQSIPKFGEM